MEERESNVPESTPATTAEWYKHVTYADAKVFIKSNITSAARSFIAIGYYLKLVRDNQMYREDGHETIWEFAQSEYGLSKSTASRYMTMNDRFSKDGDSPVIRDEYKDFGKSQLQEMLSLTDEQIEQVKPTDRVEDIRGMKKPREIPYIELPGQVSLSDFPGITPEQVKAAGETRMEGGGRPAQTYTISAQELMPEQPEVQQEAVAISQPVFLGEPIKSIPQPESPALELDEDGSCPPGLSSCPRQNWGESTEEQKAGQKECKKCWADWRKRQPEPKKVPQEAVNTVAVCQEPEPKVENEELALCPFCGGEADVFSANEVGYLGGDKYTVRCQSCMCGTGHYAEPAKAKAAWNRRTATE